MNVTPEVRQRMRVGRQRGVRASAEFTTAVEEWARAYGCSAKLEWAPDPANAWIVKIELKPNDPRRRSENPDDHSEVVVLHDWHEVEWFHQNNKMDQCRRHPRTGRPIAGYYAPRLDEMGVTGIIARLERGSLTSGRGAGGKKTAEQLAEDRRQQFRADKDRRRRNLRDDAVHDAMQKRRHRLKIPFLPVGIEFGRPESPSIITQE